MKKHILTAILFFTINQIFAHYIWIETNAIGTINSTHNLKIRFGEFSDGVFEKVNSENFKSVADFKMWLIDPAGKKTLLQVNAKNDYYAASFTPKTNGTYTLVLDNKNMKVLDFTKYDYTTFKPQYHAKARVVIGFNSKNTTKTNPDSIEIIDLTSKNYKVNKEVILLVQYKQKPLIKSEVKLFIADNWTKTLTTDKEGKVSFKLPWKTTYTIETTYEEKTPGTYQGRDYKLVWHCATYCIKN